MKCEEAALACVPDMEHFSSHTLKASHAFAPALIVNSPFVNLIVLMLLFDKRSWTDVYSSDILPSMSAWSDLKGFWELKVIPSGT